MRIVSSIILLFISMSSFAQQGGVVSSVSSNLEPARSYTLPSSSAQEAVDGADAMRYAIPISGWEERRSGQQASFSSSFDSPFSWIGRQAIISIESASAPYTLYVDDREVGSNINPSMAAQFNVTRYLEQESNTPITIVLTPSQRVSEIEGWDDDYDVALGSVVMLSQPTMYIRDVGVTTTNLSGVLNASIDVVVKSEALNERTSRINYELLSPQGAVVQRGYSDMKLDMRREDTLHLFAIIPDSMAWSLDKANLYRLNLSTQYRGRHLEYHSFEIGFRSIEQGGDGELVVNGEPQELKAIEVESSISVEQLSQIKQRGYNTIKVAAGEHNMGIYNYADSAGLYVIATAPINSSKSGASITKGGNPTNDPERLGEYIERVDALYNGVKLHPSVIAFAIADSSLNGINLYESYLYLKARERHRPIIYLDNGGEWNSDSLRIDIDRE